MRILLFNQYFWPENFRINELALSLKAHGHDVEVLTGKPNYPEGKVYNGYKSWGSLHEIWQGISVFRIPIIPRGEKSSIKLALNYLSFIVAGLIFAPWLLRKRQYDVIFVYAPSPIFQVIPASFLGWLKRVPVILWVQDLWPQSAQATGHVKNSFLLKCLEKLVSFSYAHTDLLLVQSKAFIEPVARLAPAIPVCYYPNSVDHSFYSPQKRDVPEINTLKNGFSVMFAGNIGAAQSMETVVGAAQRLLDYPEIKIVILGNGSRRDWLAAQIEQKKLNNLHLEGVFPVGDMPVLMRQASVLLVTLANQPIFELTIPSKIQAYLAVGKPIIACLNGEGAQIIKDANAGLAVNAEDSEALANAIIQLYQTSSAELEQMGANGRAYFKQHFDEGTLIQVLLEHFQAALDKKGLH